MDPTGDDWHVQIRSLLSASLGQITQNFRLISLRFTGNEWIVRFTLEAETDEDSLAINEIYEDFGSDSWNSICAWRTHGNVELSEAVDQRLKKEVIISTSRIEREQSEHVVWLYRRKECG